MAIPSGEWYILWKGANKYQTDYTYFVQRQNGSSTNSVCSNSDNSRYSGLFYNIASASYKTMTDYQNFTSEVQYWLKDYNTTVNPMVFAIEPSGCYKYTFCTWNATSYNYFKNSYYSIYSTPYIEWREMICLSNIYDSDSIFSTLNNWTILLIIKRQIFRYYRFSSKGP